MSEEEKKAIKDCDTIFICLEDMMSEESADDYRSSYLLIKNLIDNQQKEIEEKTTIIMAGAEKVKQLEKEIQRLEKDNDTILNLIEKQQKLINTFIHNEAVKEGKDFNEIKEKYYECL